MFLERCRNTSIFRTHTRAIGRALGCKCQSHAICSHIFGLLKSSQSTPGARLFGFLPLTFDLLRLAEAQQVAQGLIERRKSTAALLRTGALQTHELTWPLYSFSIFQRSTRAARPRCHIQPRVGKGEKITQESEWCNSRYYSSKKPEAAGPEPSLACSRLTWYLKESCSTLLATVMPFCRWNAFRALHRAV